MFQKLRKITVSVHDAQIKHMSTDARWTKKKREREREREHGEETEKERMGNNSTVEAKKISFSCQKVLLLVYQ